jgi:hypothetical protein
MTELAALRRRAGLAAAALAVIATAGCGSTAHARHHPTPAPSLRGKPVCGPEARLPAGSSGPSKILMC